MPQNRRFGRHGTPFDAAPPRGVPDELDVVRGLGVGVVVQEADVGPLGAAAEPLAVPAVAPAQASGERVGGAAGLDAGVASFSGWTSA